MRSGMIGKDIGDNLARFIDLRRVRIAMRQSKKRLPDRPAANTIPGRWIVGNGCSEICPADRIKKCPSNDKIAGRISDPQMIHSSRRLNAKYLRIGHCCAGQHNGPNVIR